MINQLECITHLLKVIDVGIQKKSLIKQIIQSVLFYTIVRVGCLCLSFKNSILFEGFQWNTKYFYNTVFIGAKSTKSAHRTVIKTLVLIHRTICSLMTCGAGCNINT